MVSGFPLTVYISSRIFENIPEKGPDYSHRNLVMSAFSLSCQILVMFEAHWPMKAFPSSTC